MSIKFLGFLIVIIFAIDGNLAQENEYEKNIVVYGFKDVEE
jgi:hypothetical protein